MHLSLVSLQGNRHSVQMSWFQWSLFFVVEEVDPSSAEEFSVMEEFFPYSLALLL